jgi:hypothetical protein
VYISTRSSAGGVWRPALERSSLLWGVARLLVQLLHGLLGALHPSINSILVHLSQRLSPGSSLPSLAPPCPLSPSTVTMMRALTAYQREKTPLEEAPFSYKLARRALQEVR